jgi:hypothetical protein
MVSDLTFRPTEAEGYNDRPFASLDQVAQNDLATIITINLIANDPSPMNARSGQVN